MDTGHDGVGDTRSYRLDIDGLRALAIIVVVGFHTRVAGFDGGFVGVDVFFVISGWLITSQLLQPIDAGRRPKLLDFWARRVRRLLPASGLMVLSVLVASFVLLSPLEWELVWQRAAATTLYVSNILFAYRAGDYFDGPLQSSPFLHTWSLGVEEQFYLVWPVLFAAVALLAPASQRARPRLLVAVMAVIGVTSFAAGVLLTRAGSEWAFYGLPARAWEFAVAGIALVARRGGTAWAPRARAVAAAVGVLLVAAAVVGFSEETPFPGTAAVLPVAGTLLILLAGHGVDPSHDRVLAVLRWRPLRWIGRVSYSWYLWHWPFIIFAVQLSYTDTTAVRLPAALASLGVAALTHHLVENPVRFSPALRASIGRTFAMGAGVTAACLVGIAALGLSGRQQLRQSPYRELEAARQSFRQQDCATRTTPSGLAYCEGGDPAAERLVMLVGDSHAGQWASAIGSAGRDLGVRVVLRAAGSCPAAPRSDVGPSALPVDRRPCASFQEATGQLIAELRPDAVVLADSLGSRELLFPGGPPAWLAAAGAQIAELARAGIRSGLVVDSPASADPLVCVARGDPVESCAPEPDVALAQLRTYAPAERSLVEATDLETLDVNAAICDDSACRLELDGVWIFAASSHLTRDFTLSQSAAVRDFLERVLGAG